MLFGSIIAPCCPNRLTATSEFGLDGVSVDPLEVMFVKVGALRGGSLMIC